MCDFVFFESSDGFESIPTNITLVFTSTRVHNTVKSDNNEIKGEYQLFSQDSESPSRGGGGEKQDLRPKY